MENLYLNDGENLIFECRPQDALVYFQMYRGIFPILIWSLLYSVALIFSNEVLPLHKILVNGLMFYIVILGLIYIFSTLALGKYRYVFTDQRCIIFYGLVGSNKRVIPYNRIADVDIQQGTVEALMSLSTVFIDEQAMNFSRAAWIRGLARNDAEEIAKIVSQHITKKQV